MMEGKWCKWKGEWGREYARVLWKCEGGWRGEGGERVKECGCLVVSGRVKEGGWCRAYEREG